MEKREEGGKRGQWEGEEIGKKQEESKTTPRI